MMKDMLTLHLIIMSAVCVVKKIWYRSPLDTWLVPTLTLSVLTSGSNDTGLFSHFSHTKAAETEDNTQCSTDSKLMLKMHHLPPLDPTSNNHLFLFKMWLHRKEPDTLSSTSGEKLCYTLPTLLCWLCSVCFSGSRHRGHHTNEHNTRGLYALQSDHFMLSKQLNRQNKCWQCTFLQTRDML